MKLFEVVLIAFTAFGWAQAAAQDPFVGTWKLDVAKSKFDPGPAPTSATITIGADGKVSYQSTGTNGNENWSYTYMADQESPLTGMDNSSVKEHRHGNMVEHTWKLNGGNFTGKGTISKNGKVLTYVLDGTQPDGKHEHNVEVFEKQ
jgi:hypothetical protein